MNLIVNNSKKSIFLIILIAIGPLAVYFFQFQSLSSNPNDWSTLGEYFGGVSGTILSFITVMFLILTFIHQHKETLKRDNDNKRREDIDLFFKLLDNFRSIVFTSSIKGKNSEIKEGELAFRTIHNQLKREYFGKVQTENFEAYQRSFKIFHKKYFAFFGHYFRFLHNFLKFIDLSSIDEENKKQLVNFLKSMLSQPQLCLIFYNCIFFDDYSEFKKRVEKYGLFDHLSFDYPLLEKFKNKYADEAFK